MLQSHEIRWNMDISIDNSLNNDPNVHAGDMQVLGRAKTLVIRDRIPTH
jgi:hypothetical protein